MTKKIKILIILVIIFVLILFLRFNYIYNTKGKIDLESKIGLLDEDSLNSEKIIKEHGFEVEAEYQGLSGYGINDLDYIYDNKIECTVSGYLY